MATGSFRPRPLPTTSGGVHPSLGTSASAGAADEDMFIKSFETVPRIVIYSGKDVLTELTEITKTLSDSSKDWEKRVDALKRVRSLILAGAGEFDDFFLNLKPLELAFLQSVKDLRSKVVRETCISIAFMSQSLRNRVDRFMEGLLPALFNLIPNSAKIMSSSGVVAIRFVIEYTHSPRLIPVLCANMTSKARESRKACCEFLQQMMYTWPTQPLERHLVILQEAIKKGMSDADPEARGFARKAFWGFAEHFKDQADGVIHSLDAKGQKALYGEVGMGELKTSNSSNSLSNNSLSNGRTRNDHHPVVPPRPPISTRVAAAMSTNNQNRTVSSSNSVENLYRPWSSLSGAGRIPLSARTGPSTLHHPHNVSSSKIPVYSPKDPAMDGRSMPSTSSPFRFGSAIDVGAARRARARAVIASAMAHPHPNTSILSRSVIHNRTRYESPIQTAASAAAANPSTVERQGRSNGRVSQSQPGSRSTSPSFLTHDRSFRVARKSSIPTAKSRDPSPAPDRMANVTDRKNRIRRISDSHEVPQSSPFEAQRIRKSSESQVDAMITPKNGKPKEPTIAIPPTPTEGGDTIPVMSDDLNCIDVLKPVIGELPSNQAAIKMLTKMIEQQSKSTVSSLLPDMMPALIQAYDSPDIAIRKAAVFAMVTINNVVGMDQLKEYLIGLNGSKMKLLNLYIERSKNSQATSTSSVSSSANGNCTTPTPAATTTN